MFDILASALGLILLSPVMLVIVIAIAISSSGPVFFRQERVGLNGRKFKLYKFRTMAPASSGNVEFDVGDNSRVTSLGKILRKSKLDEIPQLLNVLMGTMSIVGPRPEVEYWTSFYKDQWRIVHSVRPGISDYASIRFRNEEEILANSEDPEKMYLETILPEKLHLNIHYIENKSLWGDLRIILSTINSVLQGK